jgi:hypothetical protein
MEDLIKELGKPDKRVILESQKYSFSFLCCFWKQFEFFIIFMSGRDKRNFYYYDIRYRFEFYYCYAFICYLIKWNWNSLIKR